MPSANTIADTWRRLYRENRYCRHLSQSELSQRLRDVFLNNLRLTPKAKVGLHPMEKGGLRGMETFTHVLEEMALRHGPYPNGLTEDVFHREPIPNFVGELGRKAADALASKGLTAGDVFIKFGKTVHMKALIDEGALRIQPASFYRAPGHNGAVRDDERNLSVGFVLTREQVLRVAINPQDVPDSLGEQRVDINYAAGSNYWLYCVTNSLEERLFVDFEADACVIIKDRERFKQLLRSAAKKLVGVSQEDGNANYIDPVMPQSPDVDVPMSKHFRYSYQDEYRFIWMPTIPVENLSHVDLRLGSLEDFAELVVL